MPCSAMGYLRQYMGIANACHASHTHATCPPVEASLLHSIPRLAARLTIARYTIDSLRETSPARPTGQDLYAVQT